MILWLMSALVASTVARVNDKKMNVDRMTDQALWQAVDSCFERSLPRSAEPYLAEIKRRASDQKDMRAMMKAIDKEIQINAERWETIDNEHKYLDNEIAKAWSPMAEMLLLRRADFSDTAVLDRIFTDEMARHKAVEAVDSSSLIVDMSLYDYAMLMANSNSHVHESMLIERWQQMAGKTGSEISEMLILLTRISRSYGDKAEALVDAAKRRANMPQSKMLADYAEAILHFKNATYKADDIDISNKEREKSIEILRRIVANQEVAPRVAKEAKSMLDDILRPQATLSVENNALPKRSVPVSLESQNIDSLKISVYRYFVGIDVDKVKPVYEQEYVVKEQKAKVLLQSNSFELPSLELGHYLVVARAEDKKFSIVNVQVTDIKPFHANTNRESIVAVVSATTGAPLSGVNINGSNADENGMLVASSKFGHNINNFNIVNGKDHYTTWYSFYGDNSQPSKTRKYSLLTDRKIYRPGQTIEFKVYVYDATSESLSAQAGRQLKITLRSHNWREICSVDVVSNSLGTASGKIVIPEEVDLGQSTLCISEGHNFQHSIGLRIEEYKRTGNNIAFNPLNGAWLLGDTVVIGGVCTMADGKTIAGARVVMSIDNEVRDTLTTDSDGRFEYAIKDNSREYCFVEAKMTDLAGETTTAGISIHLDREGSRVDMGIDRHVFTTAENVSISLNSHNTNNRPYRSDVALCVKDESGKVLKELQLSVDSLLKVDLGKFADEGDYIINISYKTLGSQRRREKDRTDELMFSIVNSNDGPSKTKCEIYVDAPKSFSEGTRVAMRIGTGLENAHAMVLAEWGNAFIMKRYVDLSKEIKTIQIDVPEIKRSFQQMHVHIQIVKDGIVYRQDLRLNSLGVKDMRFEMKLASWRDKSVPGAKEKWTLTLPSELKDKETELVASMYDSRLDRLVSNVWDQTYSPFQKLPLYSHLSVDVMRNNLTYHYKNDGIRKYGYSPYSVYDFNAIIRLLHIDTYRHAYYNSVNDFIMMRATGASKMAMPVAEESADMEMEVMEIHDDKAVVENDAAEVETVAEEQSDESADQMRSDFRETVFFYPHLKADDSGAYTVEFELPDNVTTYRFRAVAHDAQMHSGHAEASLVVTKPLTVKAWLPRTVTEGDTIDVAMSVSADKSLIGDEAIKANLEIDVEHNLISSDALQTRWRIVVPFGVDKLSLKFSASSGNFVDGEIHEIPVRKRYQEVAESEPFMLFDAGQYDMANPFIGRPAQKQQLSFSYNPNAWAEILRSLPYIYNLPFESADTYLGHVESSAIAILLKQRMDVKSLIAKGSDAFDEKHELDKNSPWQLFNAYQLQHDKDVIEMLSGQNAERRLANGLRKLRKLQLADGSFAWCPGMDGSEYLTYTITETLGTLVRFGMLKSEDVSSILAKSRTFVEQDIAKSIREWRKEKKDNKNAELYFDHDMLYELYALSCIGALRNPTSDVAEALKHIPSARKLSDPMSKLLAALVYNRIGKLDEAQLLVQSVCENLVRPDDQTAHISLAGGNWWMNDVHVHSMLVIAMNEVGVEQVAGDQKRVMNWMIKEKRTTHWNNTQTTSRAVLALLTQCTDNRSTDVVRYDNAEMSVDAYCNLPLDETTTHIVIEKQGTVASWGSWKRTALVPLDEMAESGSDDIRISRTLSGGRNVGDKVTITLVVTTSTDMDFVRISDWRAASFEPTDQLSGYRGWWFWHSHDAVPYYYSPMDESVSFFISRLPRGTHKFSYECVITNGGEMSGGYADVESLYAEGFNAHSEGCRIKIGK